MPQNPSLARAALWFLIGAAVILTALLLILANTALYEFFFDHPILFEIAFIGLNVLFAFFCMIASVLGFLAFHSRYGRIAGIGGFVLIVVGLTLSISTYIHFGP